MHALSPSEQPYISVSCQCKPGRYFASRAVVSLIVLIFKQAWNLVHPRRAYICTAWTNRVHVQTHAGRARRRTALQKYMTLHSYDVYLIVLLSSGVALSYNVVHSLMIQHTSAVATTVIGEVRCPHVGVNGILVVGFWGMASVVLTWCTRS